MKQEFELSDLAATQQPGGTGTNSGDTELSVTERRLIRIGILTLGVLCILQAALNISLRLALNSKEDIDRFPLNSSTVAELCQIAQSQQNSSQFCNCCNQLVRTLLGKCEVFLQDLVIQKNGNITETDINAEESGSGSVEDFLI